MFRKIDAVDLLKQLFGKRAVITRKIRDEISVPLEYGYAFPLKVFEAIKTVRLNDQALEEYIRLQGNSSLGKGELEAIAYCQTEKCAFATNDMKAREFGKSVGVSVISLQAILRALWKKWLPTPGFSGNQRVCTSKALLPSLSSKSTSMASAERNNLLHAICAVGVDLFVRKVGS